MNNTLSVSKKTYTILGAMIGIGLLSILMAFVMGTDGKRIAANFLLNNYYFLNLGLIGLFFVAVHAISESGWHTSVQRIGEGMSAFIPVGAALLLLFFLLGGLHSIYVWTHEDHLDELLLKKQPYLNEPFFYIRAVVILTAWALLAHFIRKSSLGLDSGNMKYFSQMRVRSAIFVVVYALTSVVSAWDWLMSLDPHWFSTLYGWYAFSSMLASGIAVYILILFVLKQMGYMEHVNKEHLHDLGKYLFGFSIFWAYLWFAQYLLIWYANIPEETVYYYYRLKDFSTVFYLNLVLSFVVPFFALMTRNSKRTFSVLVPVSLVVFIGHWVDLYQMIMPGAVGGEKAGIGLLEIGMTIGYAGLFMLVALYTMSKAPLVPEKHPYYEESLDYHTNY
ncbi:MAG: quinol:cytochrome C oxidoreductase [Bacteroidetes bacterium]|nr:quinol:cytochrome C oxidoreductase [Bacteroidota bacterium]